MATGFVVTSVSSVISFRSGEKAEKAPVWLAVVTADQPQPPGTHCKTTEVKTPSVPLSKVSFTGVAVHAGVSVAVGVAVAVAVGAGVGVKVPGGAGVGVEVAGG